jgi:trans-2,3-dihydro-3-hydroxyanthranilate isomerase
MSSVHLCARTARRAITLARGAAGPCRRRWGAIVSELTYILCDVFTEQPLAGNALAVFLDGAAVPDELMPKLARELNLSETVFVRPPERGGDARLRIFTPRRELAFAGHPTLGAGALLAQALGHSEVLIETAAAPIAVNIERGSQLAWMEQPLPRRRSYDRTEELLAALGLPESMLPVELYDNGIAHIYVGADGLERLSSLQPDFARLASVSPSAGVACFAPAGSRWNVRMFAPGHGVPEDPATGSAAGPLAVHLIRHRRTRADGELTLAQGAEIGRPSTLRVRTSTRSGELAEIHVGGNVVRVGRGAFGF